MDGRREAELRESEREMKAERKRRGERKRSREEGNTVQNPSPITRRRPAEEGWVGGGREGTWWAGDCGKRARGKMEVETGDGGPEREREREKIGRAHV